MRIYFSLIAACCLTTLLSARTVQLERVVCNPGARITVPLRLDDAKGLAVASVRVTWNPDILVLTSVEQGTLAEHFSFDFTVVDTLGSAEIISSAPANITAQVGGTLAEMNFTVRDGSDALYSDLALTEVILNEETMTQDLTVQQNITPRAGVVRSIATTANCAERLGEGAVVVAADTILNHLTLATGDILQVSDRQTPVVVNGTLKVDAPITLRAPKRGWATAKYDLLKTTTTDVRFAFEGDFPEQYQLSSLTENGVTTYALAVTMEDEVPILPPEGISLSPTEQNALRTLLVDALGDVARVQVEGSRDAILAALDLGIVPETNSEEGVLTATFKAPTLAIQSFDPKNGIVKVKVIPAGNAEVKKKVVTGVIHVYGSATLGEAMTEIASPTLDLTNYLENDTRGEFSVTVELGENTFIKVTVGGTTAQ
ncbi:MAG: hypothetical protein IKM62_03355 [Kiritimatiellae bacterium]|nr:hypothetical protein [Kiritimatiellia bacterium]